MVRRLHLWAIRTWSLPESEERMSNKPQYPTDGSRQVGNAADQPILVSSAAFDAYDEHMNEQLEELVERWIHAAAPAASRPRRVVPKESRRRSEQA